MNNIKFTVKEAYADMTKQVPHEAHHLIFTPSVIHYISDDNILDLYETKHYSPEHEDKEPTTILVLRSPTFIAPIGRFYYPYKCLAVNEKPEKFKRFSPF